MIRTPADIARLIRARMQQRRTDDDTDALALVASALVGDEPSASSAPATRRAGR